MDILRVGTRLSPLALSQVDEVQRAFPLVKFVPVGVLTQGDKDKNTPLSKVEGSDFFTREIDMLLLSEDIDLALHSSKDLPDKLPKGLKILLETESVSPYDALVSGKKLKLRQLPHSGRIGTSSLRRMKNIRALRPDLEIVEIRGDILQRLSLIESGRIDALIIAQAALIRLGMESLASEVFSAEDFPTHPKQGSLVLLSKEERWQEVRSILSARARETGS